MRGRRIGAVLALLLGLAGPGLASESVRRLEVAGVATGHREGSSPRQAAVRAALADAVARVAEELVAGKPVAGGPAPVDSSTAWMAELGGDPAAYTLRYRVLEERVQSPTSPLGSQGALEVLVEVDVDTIRVAERLRELGYAVFPPEAEAGAPFVLELSELPSYAAYARLRDHLLERGGARRVVPLEFAGRRATLQVEAVGGAPGVLDRLVASPPSGLRIEPLELRGERLVVRLETNSAPPRDRESWRIDTGP